MTEVQWYNIAADIDRICKMVRVQIRVVKIFPFQKDF